MSTNRNTPLLEGHLQIIFIHVGYSISEFKSTIGAEEVDPKFDL